MRVADVVERIPGTPATPCSSTRTPCSTAVDADAPGARRLRGLAGRRRRRRAAVETALARPPFAALATASRARAEADASRDPLAHGTLLALGADGARRARPRGGGLVLAVRSDLRDDSGELYDLEAQGRRRRLLRRMVRRERQPSSRAVVSPGGILAGASSPCSSRAWSR